MEEYQVTFGYTAVISVTVKAMNIEDAKMKATDDLRKANINARLPKKICVEAEDYSPDGVTNLTKTWNRM